MSNIIAAIAIAQLPLLPERVAARRRNFELYHRDLSEFPGIDFMPEASYGISTRWLTCITIHPDTFGATRDEVRVALAEQGIESRPAWKPLHLQPAFAGARVRGSGVSERIFETGLCLPSGSNLRAVERKKVADIVRSLHRPC